jgi:uncharacterized repeat protein (TIGR01451 family)
MKRLFEFALVAALTLAAPAWAAITFDNTVSGGSAAATTIELVRDTAGGAPTGQYVGLKFSSSVALTNVHARAVVGGVGYALDATEPQDHALGDLNATAKASYWFLNIPQSTANGSLQIEIWKNGPPGTGTLEATSASYTLRSADVDQSAAANKISSVVVNGGNPLVLGQVFDTVVCYDVNSSSGTNVLINPASTAAFDPAGLQLLDVPQVQLFGSSGCSGTLISTTANQLYYVGAGSNSLNALRATYRFRAMNTLPIALSPIVSARSGQYKYNADFATFPGATVPVANNSVTLAKSVNIATSAGATTVTYTITASNSGSSAATLDSFVDTLPSSPAVVGYIADSSQFNGVAIANPVIAGQVLTWANPGGATAFTIPAGGSRSLTFQASIPATNGLYTNQTVAKIGGLTIDTTLATGDNAPATAATRVGPPVLVVNKSTGTPLVDGLTASYTVSVINNGGTAAAGVVLTDTLPAGFTYASHSAPVLAGGATRTATSDPAVGAAAPAWGSFNLPAGGSVSIAFVANVAASTPDGTVNNSASATTSTTPATITNFDGATQTSDNVVLASAVLAVTKSTSTPTVAQSVSGTSATYMLRVTNSGSATANGVVLGDALPAGFSYASHSAPVLAGGATRGSVADPTLGSATPAWGNFTLPSGASVTVTFVAAVAAGVADGSYDNSASATTTTPRKTIVNFDGATQSSDNVSVSSSALLTVSKTAGTPTVVNTSSGAQATYTLSVSNSGAAAASGVTVTDSLPAGFTHASTSSVTLGGTAVSAYQVITGGAQTAATPRWDSAPAGGFTIGPGQSLVIVFVADITAGVADGTHHNSAAATSASPAVINNFDGNADTSDDVVVTSAVLMTTKTALTPNVANSAGGASATWRVTVANSGSAAASAVKVTDLLPAGFAYASTTSVTLGGTAVSAYQVVTNGAQTAATPQWDSAPSAGFTIAAGQSLVIVFSASAAAGTADGTYHNSAQTSGNARSIGQYDGSSGSADDVTLTSSSGVALSGVVYADANHNGLRESGEGGTGLVLYAKLVGAASPSGPALQAVAVDGASGAFAFAGVAAGEYAVLIDDNATLADVSATRPAAWSGTEAASFERRNVVVASADVSALNFGLFNGHRISGQVFNDNGVGGGIANNGVRDGAEAGSPGIALRLMNGAVQIDNVSTDGAGRYTLWAGAALAGQPLKVVQDNAVGFVSTGGAPAASYDRASDSHSVAYNGTADRTGLDFGDVKANTLSGSQQSGGVPGSVVWYAHRFDAASAGTLTMSLSSVWPSALRRDANCNGQPDAADAVITSAIVVAAGDSVCLLVAVTVPAGAAPQSSDRSALRADFAHANASPVLTSLLTNEDLTLVLANGAGALMLVKQQDNAAPLPGGRITYTITYTNTAASALRGIRVADATPPYTRFVSAACAMPLPAGITACSVGSSPAAGASGAIEWTLTGDLLSAASGSVQFVVELQAGL